jgi:hypothetical protein
MMQRRKPEKLQVQPNQIHKQRWKFLVEELLPYFPEPHHIEEHKAARIKQD